MTEENRSAETTPPSQRDLNLLGISPRGWEVLRDINTILDGFEEAGGVGSVPRTMAKRYDAT